MGFTAPAAQIDMYGAGYDQSDKLGFNKDSWMNNTQCK